MSAYYFAAQMPDGHAVVIRTIPTSYAGPCYGDTISEKDHWLPLIAWFERSDDFAHGVAYVTQEAYENPNARFGFRGATIERASRRDFEEYLAKGQPNLWPTYLADYTTHPMRPRITDANVHLRDFADHPTQAWRYADRIWCIGVQRITLTESQRKIVRAGWPSSRPKFWGYPTWREQSAAWHKLLTSAQTTATEFRHFYNNKAEQALAPPEVYPMLSDNTLAELTPTTPSNDRYVQHVLIAPELRGFEYFDYPAPPQLVAEVTKSPASFQEGRIECKVGEYIVPTASGCRQENFWVVFENDEYAIVPMTPIH